MGIGKPKREDVTAAHFAAAPRSFLTVEQIYGLNGPGAMGAINGSSAMPIMALQAVLIVCSPVLQIYSIYMIHIDIKQ